MESPRKALPFRGLKWCQGRNRAAHVNPLFCKNFSGSLVFAHTNGNTNERPARAGSIPTKRGKRDYIPLTGPLADSNFSSERPRAIYIAQHASNRNQPRYHPSGSIPLQGRRTRPNRSKIFPTAPDRCHWPAQSPFCPSF